MELEFSRLTTSSISLSFDRFANRLLVRTIFDNIIYFDSFGVEDIPNEIKKLIGNKNIIKNIYRIQLYNLIMCGYFCIGFIDFMLKGRSLLDYTKLFSPNDYEKNDKIILKYFQ